MHRYRYQIFCALDYAVFCDVAGAEATLVIQTAEARLLRVVVRLDAVPAGASPGFETWIVGPIGIAGWLPTR